MGNINKRNLIFSILICITMPVTAFFLSLAVIRILTVSAAAPPATHDELKVQGFLLQENSAGISNATKLGVDPNDISTWVGLGFTFNASGQLTRVGNSLNSSYDSWYNRALHGTLDVSGCTMLTAIYVSRSGAGTAESRLTGLDVTGCTGLTALYCQYNNLTVLDISQNTLLKTLICAFNSLTELNLTYNTALRDLRCYSNPLGELDVSHNTALEYLECSSCTLTELDVTQNMALQALDCSSNSLNELNVMQNTELESLRCFSNNLTELNVAHNTKLNILGCNNNPLGELNVSPNVILDSLECNSCNLTELDVTQNMALQTLYCSSNSLTELDLTQNTELRNLRCDLNSLDEFDVTHNIELQELFCDSNNLTELDLSQNTTLWELICSSNNLTKLDFSNVHGILRLVCFDNPDLRYINMSGFADSSCSVYWRDNTAANMFNLVTSPLNKNNQLHNLNNISLILFPYVGSGAAKVTAEVKIDGITYDLSQTFAVSGAIPPYIFAQFSKNDIEPVFTGWRDESGNLITSIGDSSSFNNQTDIMSASFGRESENPTFNIIYNDLEGASNPNPLTYTQGVGLILQNPGHREGFTFTGWYDGEGNKVTVIDDTASGDIELWARWSANESPTFDIIYNDLEGASNPNPLTYTQGVGLILQSPGHREGFTFTGWYDENGNKVTVINDAASGDIELWARWLSNEIPIFNIIYNDLEGASNPNPLMYTQGVGLILQDPGHREGFTFVGWYDENGNKITVIDDAVSGDIELWTRWLSNEIPIFDIIYNDLGGASNPNPPKYTEGARFELQNPSPREGYDFTGWYDENGNKITVIDDTVSGNLILWARWKTSPAPPKTRFIPWIVAIIIFILCVIIMSIYMFGKSRDKEIAETKKTV